MCLWFVFFSVVIINLLLSYNVTGIEPVRRGLFCDDVTIAYPYRPDTVSDTVLVTCFLLGPVIIVSSELFLMEIVQNPMTSVYLFVVLMFYVNLICTACLILYREYKMNISFVKWNIHLKQFVSILKTLY